MRLLLRAGLALGLAATAACKESIAPKSLANPQQTTAQMAAFDTLFGMNNVLNSFTAVSGDIAPVAPAQLATLRALVGASNPLNKSSALRPYARGYESARMLRQLIPNLSNTSAADIFPPDIDGKTFEWDTTSNTYVAGIRTGAPPTGVRFILYAVDPFSQLPVEPVVEIGYVDLADQSTASIDKLRVTVVGSGVTFVDYTVQLENAATAPRITTAGYVTNGASSPDSLRFSGVVSVSGNASSVSVTQDVSFDVNSHDAHVRLWEKVTFTQTTAALRIYFLFKHGAETVTLDGKFDLDSVGETLDGTITVKVDGGPFATCTVAAGPGSYNLTCEGADADGLNAAEQEALDAIGNALAHIENLFAGLLNPGVNVLGATL